MDTGQIILSVIGAALVALLGFLAVKRMNDSSGASTIADAAKGLIGPYVKELHRAEDTIKEQVTAQVAAETKITRLTVDNDDLARRLAALEAKCRGIEELLADRRQLASRLEQVDQRMRLLESHMIANGITPPPGEP